MSMFNNTSPLTEAEKTGGDFAPIVKGLYILTVVEAVEGETEERVWKDTAFVNTGNMVPQLTLKFWCATEKGDVEIPNSKGVVVVNPQYTVWVTDNTLGWNRKSNLPKQGRQVLAALLNQPVDGDISFDNPSDLVGKKMKVYMSIETTKAGKERNVLIDINPAL